MILEQVPFGQTFFWVYLVWQNFKITNKLQSTQQHRNTDHLAKQGVQQSICFQLPPSSVHLHNVYWCLLIKNHFMLCSAYASALERSVFASLYSHCLIFATQLRLFKHQCQSESGGCVESKIIAIQIGNTFQWIPKETIYYNYIEFLSTVCQNL